MSPPAKREVKTTIKYENTPPPSPAAEVEEPEQDEIKREIDLEGINDDIVEGVIIQLQKTANRPHLVKELAAILSTSVKIVETSVLPLDNVITSNQSLTVLNRSANPSAIISSRLSIIFKETMLDSACAVSDRQGAGDCTSPADVFLPHDICASTHSRPGASNSSIRSPPLSSANYHIALLIISGVAIR